MTRKLTLIGALFALSALIAACGTAAIPAYEQEETSIAVARTETHEVLLTEGAIIPSDTPTSTPTSTPDFDATATAEQIVANAQATSDAATAQAEADAQATTDAIAQQTAAAEAVAAQATTDAIAAAQPGADDPLFEAVSNADPANGELIFNAVAAPACNTCHLADSETTLVGPGQYNLFARTVERIENGTIEAEGPYSYIYESIINPLDYAPEGFMVGLMPDVYEGVLTDEQVYDLIAYLVTLGD